MARFQVTSITNGNPRSKAGSQIAELPPALILLFIMILFPFIDFLYISLAYGAGWYLNQIETRQIAAMAPQAVLTATPAGNPPTITYTGSAPYSFGSDSGNTQLPQSLNWNGFMGVTELGDSPTVTYLPASSGSTNSQIGKAQVTTTVSIKPFLSENSHWLPQVPGLNQPFNFTYTNTTFQEEKTPAPPPAPAP